MSEQEDIAVKVENLRQILQTDDIELVIKLLEQNDYDETKAAQAFYHKPNKPTKPH